jgi:glycosyltransferase involved in cell wall biosynthesis
LPERYFISVGSDHYRKNQPRLAEAWCRIADRIPEGLVLVGRTLYADTFSRIENEMRLRGLASRFVKLDDVDDTALPALYRGATAAVAPSLHEGFGMTLLEAMGCGTPVVCCDNAAYREVVDDAAIFFDGLSVAGIAERLLEISNDEVLARSLVKRGFERLQPMTWSRTAEQTWQVYEALLWP